MITRTLYRDFSLADGSFDTGAFVESFLIYDTILLSSPSTAPRLAEIIGVDELCDLLSVGTLAIECGGPTAQAICDYRSPGFFSNKPLNRPLRYAFETIYVDPKQKGNLSVEDRLARTLTDAKGHELKKADLDAIHSSALASMRLIDGSLLKTGDDFRRDLELKPSMITGLLIESLASDFELPVYACNTQVKVEEVYADVFQINTNLGRLLGRSDEELHNFFKRRFFEITGTNLQLHRMRAVDAIAGLNPIQAHITAKRVDFLSKIHSQADLRKELTRIIEVTGVPTLAPDAKIDMTKLLALRDSAEAAAFRDWLHTSKALTDHEICEITSSWRNRLGEMLSSENAKGLRWLSSTGWGSLEPISGTLFSGIDYFLDKLLPGMGPIGFLVGEYKNFVKSQMSGGRT